MDLDTAVVSETLGVVTDGPTIYVAHKVRSHNWKECNTFGT